jgi:DNA-3-methyladenine glycosylase
MARRTLPQSFYNRKVAQVARELLGMTLVRETDNGRTSGTIVETEAYLHGTDQASHSFRGKTRRNASMFGPAGHAYVYTIHTRFCLNAVAEREETGAAVLIRAIEPLDGLSLMEERRGQSAVHQLTTGPGKLCEALAIDKALDGWNLTLGEILWIERPKKPRALDIATSPRIGISSAQDLLLRFFVRGNRFVSGPKHLHGPVERNL